MSQKKVEKKLVHSQKEILELANYFLKNVSKYEKKEKNLKRRLYNDNFATLIDPINISTKDKSEESTESSQTKNSVEEKMKKSLIVNKDIGEYREPKYEKKKFQKIPPKFTFIDDEFVHKKQKTNVNITNAKTNIKINDQIDTMEKKHRYTKSELDLLKTDEKVAQNEIEEISGIKNNETDNIDTYEEKGFSIFHFLFNIEKIWQELTIDLINNGFQNSERKYIAVYHFLNFINDNTQLYDILNGEEEMNIFFNRALCLNLIILFNDNFENDINYNVIKEILTCCNYYHINLLYVIDITLEKESKNTEIKHNSTDENDYQKCKGLIDLNMDKLDLDNYKSHFHNNNKIMKYIILNLLNRLVGKEQNISKNISDIFNQSKKLNFKEIINTYVKINPLINAKLEEIISNNLYQDKNTNEDNINLNNSICQIEPPFLSPKKTDDKREYCLVLDLDETLVHFCEDGNQAYVKVRFGAENFINTLSEFCEIVIFTASTKYYADTVIDGLDCKNAIDFILYREYTTEYNGIYVKDISKLGRDLNKIIIVDNIEYNYILQPNNGLNIIDFEGEDNDNELLFLLEDLLEVVSKPGKIIPDELPKIRKKMEKRYCNYKID